MHSWQVLCTLLEGNPPTETTTPPRPSANFEATPDEAAVEQKQDGCGTKAQQDEDGTKGNGTQAPLSATEEIIGGSVLGVDGVDRDGGSRLLNRDRSASEEERSGKEKPEKSRFNVLLGMLTIATMVDADGKKSTSSWAAKSFTGMGQDELEHGDRAKSGRKHRVFCRRISTISLLARKAMCIFNTFLSNNLRALRVHSSFGGNYNPYKDRLDI